MFPIENDRWFVTLIGRGEDHPPTDPDKFISYAEGLPVSDVKELLEEHEWVSEDIHKYPFPSNRRYRYEELDQFPGGLAVIGDAIASFNPTYAQGMSVAALEATILHDVLAENGVDDVGKQLVERAVPVVDTAWFLAVAFDSLFPETSGPVPDGVDSYREFVAHLAGVVHDDRTVAEAFWRVTELENPPSSLLRPAVARRVFGTQETDGYQAEVPSWVPRSIRESWPLIDEQLGSPAEIRTWPGLSGKGRTESIGDD